MGNTTFLKRYGALLKSVEQRNAELAAKAEEEAAREAESMRKQQKRLAEERKKQEAEERRKQEMRIVEKDERLREYQQIAVKEILSTWQKKRNVMLQMPTGTGKTRLFVALINALSTTEAENYNVVGTPRFLIVTHREELVEQISETLNNHYHLAHAIFPVRSEECGVRSNISISSIQYLTRQLKVSEKRVARSGELKKFDFIIIDEAHHSLADSYRNLWGTYPESYKLGVTATPYRLNGDGFFPLYYTLITSQTISQYIEQGYLADYRYFTVSSRQAALQKVNRLTRMSVGGDYQIKDLQEIYANSEEIEFLYDCYKQHAFGKRGIIYAVNQLHAEMITSFFAEQGVSIANIDSKTASARRKELIAQFRSGELQVLVNVELFGEGFDCPAIEFAMLARPTKSLAMYLQQVGRALRPFGSVRSEKCGVRSEASPQPSPRERENHAEQDDIDNKVIILDCVGLYNRFGLPENEWDWNYFFKGNGKGKRRHWQKLGLDSENEEMTEIDTPREVAKKKSEQEALVTTLEAYRTDAGLWGIRNMLGAVIVKPCCMNLTKTECNWFYGKDEDGNLRIYDQKGTLIFKQERCEIEIIDKWAFYINALTEDGGTVRIGPFDKSMRIWNEKYNSYYVYVDKHALTYSARQTLIYVLTENGVVMTSRRLTLETRVFRRSIKYLDDTVFVGFDNKLYKFSTIGSLYAMKLPEKEVKRLLGNMNLR